MGYLSQDFQQLVIRLTLYYNSMSKADKLKYKCIYTVIKSIRELPLTNNNYYANVQERLLLPILREFEEAMDR